ncbi:MAG: PIG-L family deacetylase, partial [Acidobacteriaceae bacterium]|nr:PIG-L family deacetylase [Acidobacteriaceae bacterium]
MLCLGAHADDIEIGCGGTILRWLEENRNLEIFWVVLSSDQKRKKEALKGAELFLQGARKMTVAVESFRDGFFPYDGAAIKQYFESLKQRISPDVVLTHYRHDLHQDHRLVCDLTWNTFRRHFILEYEIPKYDGDLGQPNFFSQLSETICRKKIQHILKVYKTQTVKHWLTEDTLQALLRLRGVESCAEEKYAEAFYCRKM